MFLSVSSRVGRDENVGIEIRPDCKAIPAYWLMTFDVCLSVHCLSTLLLTFTFEFRSLLSNLAILSLAVSCFALYWFCCTFGLCCHWGHLCFTNIAFTFSTATSITDNASHVPSWKIHAGLAEGVALEQLAIAPQAAEKSPVSLFDLLQTLQVYYYRIFFNLNCRAHMSFIMIIKCLSYIKFKHFFYFFFETTARI